MKRITEKKVIKLLTKMDKINRKYEKSKIKKETKALADSFFKTERQLSYLLYKEYFQ